MNDDKEEKKIEYAYPKEELDKIIEQMMEGIMPIISDEMMNEVLLRQKELASSTYGQTVSYDDLDTEDTQGIIDRHKELLKKQIDNERHKATKNDVVIINVSEEKKKEIREAMSVSIVRPNPNDPYNKTDEQLYQNAERRAAEVKLRNLRNCYFNQTDYLNAMKIIFESIEESLGKHGNSDYPEMSYAEAIKAFNKGDIRFTFRDLPKLYINHSTMVTDKSILKGIIFGEVELKDRKSDIKEAMRSNAAINKPYNPIHVNYTITSDDDYNKFVELHRKGFDTPISTAIQYRSTTYNPGAVPRGSRFFNGGVGIGNVDKRIGPDGYITLHDWGKEGSGSRYFDMLHGRKKNLEGLMNYINQQNDGHLGGFIEENARQFLQSMKGVNGIYEPSYNYMIPNYAQPVATDKNYNVEAAQMEKQLLESIQINARIN